MSWLGSVVGRAFLPILILLCALATSVPASAAVDDGRILVLEASLSGAISPSQADMLDAALSQAQADHAALLLLRLDTPGGSIDVMRRMVKTMLNAPLPIVVWVAPAGARAASAGVFLVAASTLAAMAPQTSIGSASPVGPGGSEIKGNLQAKIINDLESLLRGMAASHGRNADWYVRSVSRTGNSDALEAAKLGVVECIAVDRADLMAQVAKRGLATRQGLFRFDAAKVRYETFVPGWRHDMLSWLVDPQVAYILLLIGMAGLFFELTTPGAVLPGVLGSLSLLLALYALSVLPTNATGLLLLLLGAVFFVLEIFITSYGLLGLAGVISLFLGSVLLFRGQGLGGLPMSFILPSVIGISLILGILLWMVTKAQLRRSPSGVQALVGQEAMVRSWQGPVGKVFVRGEIWDATTDEDDRIEPGQRVRILAVEGLVLRVTAE